LDSVEIVFLVVLTIRRTVVRTYGNSELPSSMASEGRYILPKIERAKNYVARFGNRL
jgi:hypothetical protein